KGGIVLALATLEHTGTVLAWADASNWQVQLRQIQVQQGVRIGPLTRWQPLTPITIVSLNRLLHR
ncbi:MAG: cobalamin biosynthesis bifunctional protein CbiET, partial [Cyanobacteria bacterium J06638_6]